MTTPKKITEKYSTNQAIKTNFYTKKATLTTATVKKRTKITQVINKGNVKWFGSTCHTAKCCHKRCQNFLKLLYKYFAKTNKLHKMFNCNSGKVSYSCTENISQIISNYDKNILQPNKNKELHVIVDKMKNILYRIIAST